MRAAEAWLIADEERLCEFLRVERHHLRGLPEQHDDPKRALVDLARHSKSRAIVADMVPAPKTSARVGPAYSDYIIRFARELWRPEVAETHSDSLARCIKRLKEWV